MSVFIIFVWACTVFLLCQSPKPWLQNLGGALGFAGALVCANLLFHII